MSNNCSICGQSFLFDGKICVECEDDEICADCLDENSLCCQCSNNSSKKPKKESKSNNIKPVLTERERIDMLSKNKREYLKEKGKEIKKKYKDSLSLEEIYLNDYVWQFKSLKPIGGFSSDAFANFELVKGNYLYKLSVSIENTIDCLFYRDDKTRRLLDYFYWDVSFEVTPK